MKFTLINSGQNILQKKKKYTRDHSLAIRVCLPLLKWGHSMSEEEYENSTVSTKEFVCNFSENFALIDTEVMCSRPSDEDSHGPMFISLRPASFSSGDRRLYRMGATLRDANLRRKERQKQNKRKGRPPTSGQAASSTAAA